MQKSNQLSVKIGINDNIMARDLITVNRDCCQCHTVTQRKHNVLTVNKIATNIETKYFIQRLTLVVSRYQEINKIPKKDT